MSKIILILVLLCMSCFFLIGGCVNGSEETGVQKKNSKSEEKVEEGKLSYKGKSLEEWIQLCGVEKPSIRGEALFVVCQVITDKAAVPVLLKEINNEKYLIRGDVIEALGKRGDKSVVPEIIKAMKDKSDYVRAKAARALGRLGDKSAIPVLMDTLEKEYWYEILRNCAASLGDLDAKEAVPVIIKRLKERVIYGHNDDAVIALGQLGNKAAIPVLIDVLQEGSCCIENNVVKALKTLSGQDFGSNVAKWRKWWEAVKNGY